MKLICAAPTSPDAHGPLTVRVLTTAAERQRFDALLAAEHFLGPRFPAGDRLYQVPAQEDRWVGLLLWCAPALHLKDRDAWIGWDPLTRAQRLKLIVNQARFLIPDAARRPNLASQILAAATTALPDQWRAHHGYAPLLAETFTDPEAHAGTCYKAAGWLTEARLVELQRRRSQTEGRIAIFKNGFLGRPLRAKGFEHRELAVSWQVLTHNLWVLARLEQKQALALAT